MPMRIWEACVSREHVGGMKPSLNVPRWVATYPSSGYPQGHSMVSSMQIDSSVVSPYIPRSWQGMPRPAGGLFFTDLTPSNRWPWRYRGVSPRMTPAYSRHLRSACKDSKNGTCEPAAPATPPLGGRLGRFTEVVQQGRRTHSSLRWGKPTTWRRGPGTTNALRK